MDAQIDPPLRRAIQIAGSQRALAERVTAAGRKCTQQTISYWLSALNGEVPAEWCRYLEAAVGIPCIEFRPEVFLPVPRLDVSSVSSSGPSVSG